MMQSTAWILVFVFCFLIAGQYVAFNTLYRANSAELIALPGGAVLQEALGRNFGTVFVTTLAICAACLVLILLCLMGSYLRLKNVWTEHYAQVAAKEQELSMERDRIDGVYEDLRRMGALTSHAGMHNQTTVMQWLDGNFDSFHRANVENLLDGERSTAILFLALDDVDTLYDGGHGQQLIDAILKEMGEQLEQWIRSNDLVARWQDASFMLVMTYISLKDALLRAEDFRLALVDNALHVRGVDSRVSISCGLSMMLTSDSSWRQAMERAKKALSHRNERGLNTLYHEIL
jgi:diguanylate cyclase (GGDEF)-like protein